MALDKRTLVNVAAGVVTVIAVAFGVAQCSGKKAEAEKAEAFKTALEKVVQKDTVVAGENKNTVTIELGQGAVNNGNIVVVNGGTENKSVKAHVNNNDVNVKLCDATKNNGNIVATNDESVDKVEAVVNNNCKPVSQPVAKQPATKQPAAKQPAAKQPAAKQPAAKQPAAKQPVAKQPVAKQPVNADTVPANKKKYYVITSVAVVKKVNTVYRER